MAETRQERVSPREVVEIYKASVYEKISVFSTAAAPAFFGFKPSIPPAGSSGAFRNLITDDIEFFIGPGDSVWVSYPPVALGPAAVFWNIVASPLPWPVDMLERLGIQSPPPVEALTFLGVPIAGEATRVYRANDYVEATVGIRVSTPGTGIMSFQSSMNNAYIVPSGFRPTKVIMAPGDQLFVQGLVAPMDFNVIISPVPWWNGELLKMAREIEWPRISRRS